MATKTITVEIGATQKMNADIHLNADDSELQKFGKNYNTSYKQYKMKKTQNHC